MDGSEPRTSAASNVLAGSRSSRDLGEFIREQRRLGRLSLRKLSELSGISNPYLSQIERGLRRPSAEILQQIARALSLSVETPVRPGRHPRALDRPVGADRRDPPRPLARRRAEAHPRPHLRVVPGRAPRPGIRGRSAALGLTVRTLAVLSMHTSPLAQPGAGDSGGMNVYVRELVSALAQAGVRTDVYVRRWRDDLPEVVDVEPGLPGRAHRRRTARPGQGEARRGGRRVHRRRGRAPRAPRATPTPSTPTTGCRAWPATGSSTSCRCRWCRRSTRWPGSRPRPAMPSRPGGSQAETEVIGCSDAILASCEAEVTQLVQLYGAERQRIEIVPPGVDHAFFSPGERRGARQALQLGDHPVLLFVGRIQPLKGVDVAVRALGELSSAHPGALLVVVGGASGAGRPGRRGPRAPTGGRARPRAAGPLRAAPAPPPAVDLLPGRRRLHRAQPLRVVRPRRPRGGRLRHPGGGRRRGRADAPWSTTVAPGFLVDDRDPCAYAGFVDRILRDDSLASAMAGAAAHGVADYRWSTTAGPAAPGLRRPHGPGPRRVRVTDGLARIGAATRPGSGTSRRRG